MDIFVGIVLLNKNNEIYLVREKDKNDVGKGRWNLPGGSVDENESLVDSARRETKEETGYDNEIKSLLGCYKAKNNQATWIYIVFKAIVDGGVGKIIDSRVIEGKWFTKDDLNNLDLVHDDIGLVYKLAVEDKGLSLETVKYIKY